LQLFNPEPGKKRGSARKKEGGGETGGKKGGKKEEASKEHLKKVERPAPGGGHAKQVPEEYVFLGREVVGLGGQLLTSGTTVRGSFLEGKKKAVTHRGGGKIVFSVISTMARGVKVWGGKKGAKQKENCWCQK